jgi:hypothetical protein
MATNQPRPPQRTWKTKGGGGTTSNDAAPRWKQKSAKPQATGGKWSWRTKAWLGAALAAVVAVVFVVVINWIRLPNVPYLVLIGASYQDNLAIPHNVYGRHSLDDLAKWCRDDPRILWRRRPRVTDAELTELTVNHDWKKFLDQNFEEDTVVIYLALHGGTDEKGPFLFRNGPPGESRVPITNILERLKQLDAKKNKILILDATQVVANWPLGMLQNDFAEGLAGLNAQIQEVPNLVVISSSAKDQRSWVAPEFGRTIFGHAIVEGLQGKADQDTDTRVTGLELFQNAAERVRTWVAENRAAAQTPELLPAGEEGINRAKAIQLAVTDKPGGARSVDFELSPEVTGAWRRLLARRNERLSPDIYAPHLWREYQDTLLRYEQLVLAKGDRAGAIGESLKRLEGQLDAARQINLTQSESNSIPVSVSLGRATAGESRGDEDLEALWHDSGSGSTEAAKIKGKSSTARIGTFLLKKAREAPPSTDAPDANFFKASEMLQKLYPSGSSRPVELHYLGMLTRRDVFDPRPPLDDILEFLRLRQEAEEVAWATRSDDPGAEPFHPYAEAVFPWIKASLASADELRRFGEDHLFGNDDASWNKARDYLKQADDAYKQVKEDSQIIRDAYRIRDRVLAELPYYSQWLLQEYSGNRDANMNGRREKAEQLWKQVHELSRILNSRETQMAEKLPDRREIADLKERIGTIRNEFNAISKAFAQTCDLHSFKADNIENWLTIRDLLCVPYVDLHDREALVAHCGRISKELQRKTEDKSVVKPDAKYYQNAAVYQGRMALEQIGRGFFDPSKTAEIDRFDATLAQLKLSSSEIVYQKNAAHILAESYREASRRIEALAESAQKADSTARKKWADADLLCRCLPGSAAARLSAAASKSTTELRSYRIHDLLLAQAERTMNDFWAAADPAVEQPYFQTAAQGYVKDARTLMELDRDTLPLSASEARLSAVSELEARLKSTPEISLQASIASHDVTSETSFSVSHTLKADKAVPAGYPAVWLARHSPQLARMPSDGAQKAGRVLKGVNRPDEVKDSENPAAALVCQLQRAPDVRAPLYPEPIATTTTALGFYRGHRLNAETTVNLHLRPDVVMFHERPKPTCSVAVMADPDVFKRYGAENSGIVIILDASGSMKDKGRFEAAKTALDQVVQQIPRGTTVSVWKFGGKDPDLRSTDVKLTIKELISKEKWDPNNAAQRANLMEKIGKLDPDYGTPLLHTMIRARKDLDGITGMKSLVVLTDGDDSEYEKDRALGVIQGKKLSPSDFLSSEFGSSDISINIVAFMETATDEKARRQLGGVVDYRVPGKYLTVQEAPKLAEALNVALSQRLRCQIYYSNGKLVEEPGVPKYGVDVTESTGGFQVPIHLQAPGIYKLRMHTFTQEIHLRNGDCLCVKARIKGNDEIGFVRVLYADTRQVLGNAPAAGWRATVMQNQYLAEAGVQMFASLEEASTLEPGTDHLIKQIRPTFAWFEVSAQDSERPVALFVRNLGRYWGPAWGLDVAAWPKRTAPPFIRIWWLTTDVPFAPLPQNLGKKLGREFSDAEFTVGTDRVRIESLRFENRVRESDGATRPCMVVRIASPDGHPMIARVSGFDQPEQHQVYRKANRTTSIFWDVTKDKMEETKDVELGVVSLSELKKTAHYAELKATVPPAPASTRPNPIQQPEYSSR